MLHYSVLPYFIAFAALVFVFRSMLRHHAEGHLDSWLLGWTFLFLHFAAQLLNVSDGVWRTGIATVSLLCLDLAGIAFILAASRFDLRVEQSTLLTIWATALMAYSTLTIWGVERALPYYVTVAMMAASFTALNYRMRARRSARDNIFSCMIGLALPVLLAGLIPRDQMGYGINATISWLYLVAGIRYWQRFEQKSTGVLTAVLGFVVAAATFPVGLLIEQMYLPHLKLDAAVRNIPKLIIAVGVLLTFLEEEIERTEHMALHDVLTGLPNRRLLEDRLENMLERAERNQVRAAVLMVDLNGFKQINDMYGHAVGDEFLREAALRLGSVVRKADTLARTGGDEFTVLVSDIAQPNGAEILVQKLQQVLDQPIPVRDLKLLVSGSIGVALYPDDGKTANELRAIADANMYQAKRDAKTLSTSPSAGSSSVVLPSAKTRWV